MSGPTPLGRLRALWDLRVLRAKENDHSLIWLVRKGYARMDFQPNGLCYFRLTEDGALAAAQMTAAGAWPQ
jgi:hypothetical protein